jgi:transposase
VERLEAKKIKGHTYYYYSSWGWKNGKCRRLWQKYLGKLDKIVQAVEGRAPVPQHAEVYSWGLPVALRNEARRAQIMDCVNQLCPKRDQGLSPGDYIGLAAINRAAHPVSKQAMWQWFSTTSLVRQWPEVTADLLSSQRFWDHMDRIEPATAQAIWQQIITGVVQRDHIDLSRICYDGTNFYTFIDTFNTQCQIARRGKNKQGRSNLRQVSYALFCSTDGHLPLFYDVYEGNCNDSKEFPRVLERFQQWLKQHAGQGTLAQPTLVFDKGNNSEANFELIDSLKLNYVGSMKLDEHSDLAQVSNRDERWRACSSQGLTQTKSWRLTQEVYGKPRVVVVTYNESLFQSQWATVQNDVAHAAQQLAALRQTLQNRIDGTVKGGQKPTLDTVRQRCRLILNRQHLGQLITTTVTETSSGMPQLEYSLDESAQQKLCDTFLGKTILVTGHDQWTDEQVIRAYRSQFIIEEVFREMKDRHTGCWWPMNHWTDSKIHVHGLYCTIAILLRGLMWRRVRAAGLPLSMERMLAELESIREVINVYAPQRGVPSAPPQSVLTRLSDVQSKLVEILDLKKDI